MTRGSIKLAGRRVILARDAQSLGQASTGGSDLGGAAVPYRIAAGALADDVRVLHGGLGGIDVDVTNLWANQTSAGGATLGRMECSESRGDDAAI